MDELKNRSLTGASISIKGKRDLSTKEHRFIIPLTAVEGIMESEDDK